MRVRAAFLAVAFFLALPVAGADPERTVVLERVANRLILSDGQVVEVIGQQSYSSQETLSATAFLRTGGEVFSISSRAEAKWRVSEFTISGHKARISVRIDLGYTEYNLPVPVSVLIGDTIHRFLSSSVATKPVEPEARRRAQVAISKLPSKFVAGLRVIGSLADSPDEAGLPPALIMLGELFDEGLPPVGVIDSTPLKPQEIDAIRSTPPEL